MLYIVNMDIPCVYRVSVKALIEDEEGRILLVKDETPNWQFPGGGLEHGELPREGLAREIKEEIGHELINMNPMPTAFWTITNKDRWYGFVLYGCSISGQFTASEEAEQIKYFTRDEINSLPLHVNTAPYFKQLIS